MNTRAISTATTIPACDVCGRNLLRGERAETYLDGGDRHTVCELCTARALHGGWVREGELPDYLDAGTRVVRRRSLLRRLRPRRASAPAPAPAPASYPGPEGPYDESEGLPLEPPRQSVPERQPPPPPAPTPVRAEAAPRPSERRTRQREPRHVRAVPTSAEHKMLSAVEAFNGSEHPRTVAGISRSLGLPQVAILPSGAQSSVVKIVVAWELCWYSYELDLSDEDPAVRVAAQGYELDELPHEERQANAGADERGRLAISA